MSHRHCIYYTLYIYIDLNVERKLVMESDAVNNIINAPYPFITISRRSTLISFSGKYARCYFIYVPQISSHYILGEQNQDYHWLAVISCSYTLQIQ